MKYVIAQSGTHQLRVEEEDLVEVDQLTSEIGDRIELPVMLLSDSGTVKVGSPLVEGVKVSATVVEHFRGRKIRVFKYKAKNRYRRKRGHRQTYTRLRIRDIELVRPRARRRRAAAVVTTETEGGEESN